MAFSLVLGAIFVPLFKPSPVKAGIFSSLTAKDVYAGNTFIIPNNSQTMALLEAHVLPSADPKAKKTEDEIDEDSSVNIDSENALVPDASPIGATGGADTASDFIDNEASVYVVRKGDALSQIAEMFGVSVNTILWANDMKKGDKLVEGDVLFILPISGLEHTVAKGQTLQSISKMYKADIQEILRFNDIPADTKLAIGDKLIIPNAEKAAESGKPVQNLKASVAKDTQYYQAHPTIKNLSGYYVNPVPGYRKSQGIHDKNAVDLAIATGTPIHAAAGGTVTLARTGYNGGFGNLVIISHPNGTETLYAHQSKLATTTGAKVSQGQVIGYVGSTGHSTGPHLHFEVHGARNPGADGSWSN